MFRSPTSNAQASWCLRPNAGALTGDRRREHPKAGRRRSADKRRQIIVDDEGNPALPRPEDR
jgi:hypothetical protein